MKWPKRIVVFEYDGNPLDLRVVSNTRRAMFDDERIYVLAPKRKPKKKPEGSGK